MKSITHFNFRTAKPLLLVFALLSGMFLHAQVYYVKQERSDHGSYTKIKGQTFTTLNKGALISIRLYNSAETQGTTLKIMKTSDCSNILYQQSGITLESSRYATINLLSPLFVEANTNYTFELSSNNWLVLHGLEGNPYPDGYNTNGGCSVGSIWHFDLAFWIAIDESYPHSEIEFKRGNTNIADGSEFKFGDIKVGTSRDTTLTIKNTGDGILTFTTPISFQAGAHADFAIITQPTVSELTKNQSTTFTIRFSPGTTGSSGRSASIAIDNNDPNENPYNITFTGGGGYPSVTMYRENSNITIPNGGSYDFGTKDLGTTTTFNIKIQSYRPSGSALLIVQSEDSGGANPEQFGFDQTYLEVPNTDSQTFVIYPIRFSPTSLGSKTAWIKFNNNTDDDNPYIINLSGNVVKQEINLKELATDLPDNSTVDFGYHNTNVEVQKTFTIENLGDSPTNLDITTPLTISGAYADEFSIISQPASSIPAGGSTTFTVAFDGTYEGNKSANISISNNDSDENPYDLNLVGKAKGTSEMTVTYNNLLIVNGDDTPSAGDGTDFGTVGTEQSLTRTFTIHNAGDGYLRLFGSVQVWGDDPDDFIITQYPTDTINVFNGSSDFKISFQPPANGPYTAEIQIANNDADNDPYVFSISGMGNDELNPFVTSYYPPNNESCFLRTSLTLGFNEKIWATAGKNLSVYNSANILFEQIPVDDPRVSIDDSIVTINPNGSFIEGTEYYVLIDGGAFYDVAGDEYSGIQSSSVWRFTATQSEPPGQCLSFDGIDDYGTTALTLPQAGTIEFWFSVNDVESTHNLWSAGNQYWQMFVAPHSGIHCYVGQYSIISTSGIATNQWNHVALTWQKILSQVTFSLYINGTLYATVEGNAWVNPGSQLNIASSEVPDNFLNGKIDEFRIWNTVRTSTQIQDNTFKTITPTGDPIDYPSLLAYYKCDEFGGSVLSNEKSGSYSCTLHNMTDQSWVRSLANFGDYGKTVSTLFLQTSAGVAGKAVTASLSTNEIPSNLGIYATGNGTRLVYSDDFGNSGATQRRNLFWGVVEHGNVTADLIFSYSGLVINESAELMLLKRTNAVSPWVDVTSQAVHDQVNKTFTLMDVTNFCEFTIGGTSLGTYAPRIIFVKYNASGNNDGTSWVDAYTSLENGIIDAKSGDQIWVAKGTYLPEKETGGLGARYKSFSLKNGVTIYGGFAGNEDPDTFDIAARDIETNETILSGDLNSNGPDNNDSYHVVYHPIGINLNSTAVLDGFTITGGNANGTLLQGSGGGISNNSATPTMANLNITNNFAAENGGGMYNSGSSPYMSNVHINQNQANSGGGIFNTSSSPQLTNVLIAENTAQNGGGMYNNFSYASFTNVTITGNTASGNGGGVYNTISSDDFKNSIIWGNTATTNGHQFYLQTGSTALRYSCYSNETGDVINNSGIFVPDLNTVTQNPLFGDEIAGDYRIFNNSPCADKGKNAYNDLNTDIRGFGFGRKLYRKNNAIPGIIDFGAYEHNRATDPQPPCINPTFGGEIAADPTSACIIQDTIIFSAILPPAGYSVDLEYQWQWSADNSLFVDIPGATSENYSHEEEVDTTTWFRRLARVDCDPNGWINATPSNVIEFLVEHNGQAGSLTKQPDVPIICKGVEVSAALTPGSGGNNTDILQSRTFDGISWSDWESYLSGNPVSTDDVDTIEIRTWRDATLCSRSDTVSVSWAVEQTPITGILNKFPDATSVCYGDTVLATLTSGSGGNGTEVLEVRVNDGYGWSDWEDYISGDSIATLGLDSIQIHTWRKADNCEASEIVVAGWEIINPPTAGDLIRIPDEDIVCEGEAVSATYNPGFGGNGTDVIQMRAYDGVNWSEWENYIPGTDVPTTGKQQVQIQTWREADTCGSSGISWIEWQIEALPVAGNLEKNPDDTKVCEGALVSATLTTGSGGNGSDSLSYRTYDGASWSGWEAYITDTEISTTGKDTVEIQTLRKADYCSNSTANMVSWTVEQTPVSGTLTKTPNVAIVCESSDVSATLTAGSGGNGTDSTYYRTKTGSIWSAWAAYTLTSNISTTGKTNVEIHTKRKADYCTDAAWNTISWLVYDAFAPGSIKTTGETICYNADPAEIGSGTGASGGNESFTYAWYKSTDDFADSTLISGEILSSYNPPSGLTETTSYRRYAKDGTCNTTLETSTGTWTVTVRDEFTPGAIETTGETICYNADPAEIGSDADASGGGESIIYAWYKSTNDFADSTLISGAALISYNPPTGLSETTSYRRYAKDGTCNTTLETSTGTWTVTVRDEFTPGSIETTGETICYNGDPSEIGSDTDASGGDETFTYAWYKSPNDFADSILISGAALVSYNPPTGLTGTTSYRRYAKDATCIPTLETSIGTWTVTVRDEFTPGAIETTGETICYNGDPAEIGIDTDASGGDETFTYAWYKSTNDFADSTLISGAALVSYNPPTGLTETTNYRRYAKDGTCNTTLETSAGTWTVTVYDDFTPGAIATIGETICYNGDPDEIGNDTDASGGDEAFTYAWYKSTDDFADSILISGAALVSYNPPTGLSETTSYHRYAKDGTCNTTLETSTGTWTVTVRDEFTPGSIETTGETICYNDDPAEIGSDTDASGGDEAFTYAWYKSTDAFADSTIISGATLASYNPPTGLTETTSYCRYAKDGSCNTTLEKSTGTWTVTIQPKPGAFAGNDATIGEGKDYLLSDASAENYSSVSWTTNGDGSFSDINIVNTTYVPGENDKTVKEFELCLHVEPLSPCIIDSTDCIKLTIANGNLPTISITSPVDGSSVYTNPVTISGIASDADENLSLVEVKLNTGSWQTATGTSTWTIGLNLEPGKNTLQARAKDGTDLYSDVASIKVLLSIQIINIPKGWSAISSYLSPLNLDLTAMMDEITSNNNLVIMLSEYGVYWPSQNYNTIGNWSVESGYKLKMNNAGEFTVRGDSLTSRSLDLSEGYHIIPVLSNVACPITSVFNDPLNDIFFMYDVRTNALYWPQGEIFSLTTLLPGKGYISNFNKAVTLSYPYYSGFKSGILTDNTEPEMNGPWSLTRTGNAHFVAISSEAVNRFGEASFIGAFDSFGNCIGYTGIDGREGNYLLNVFGNDAFTDAKDGAEEAEPISFRSYNRSTNLETELNAEFNTNFPDSDGSFVSNGQSAIINFKESSTGNGETGIAVDVLIYPNPAKDAVNIAIKGFRTLEGFGTLLTTEGKLVKSFTLTGIQTRLNVQDLLPGVYVLRIENTENVIIKRLVIQ